MFSFFSPAFYDTVSNILAMTRCLLLKFLLSFFHPSNRWLGVSLLQAIVHFM